MDILESAIKMEIDGEKYYMDLAKQNKDNSLHDIFVALAKDEAHHAEVIRAKREGREAKVDAEGGASLKSVFGDGSSFEFAGSKPEHVDVYRDAQEKEKASIALYKKWAEEQEDAKELSDFLIAQEQEHFFILDEIVKAVDRPNEWVESAEFGVREEY